MSIEDYEIKLYARIHFDMDIIITLFICNFIYPYEIIEFYSILFKKFKHIKLFLMTLLLNH